MRVSRWWTDSAHPLSRFTRLTHRCLAGGLLLLLLLSRSALALPEDACIKDDKCKDHYTKAVKFYKDEYYDEALTEFQAAYSSRAMALLLVNIGRTLQKLGRPKDALTYYERYLAAESKLDPDTKKRVDEYITQVKALIGTDADKSDQPDKANQPAATATPKPVQPMAPATPEPPPPPPPGRNLLIAGSVLAGIGLAGIAAGVGLGVASQGQYSTFQNSNDEFDKLAAKSSAQSFNDGAIVAGILGTAVGATGVALIAVGARTMRQYKRAKANSTGSSQPQPAPATAPAPSVVPAPTPAQPAQSMLAPWISGSGAGLVFQGGF